jgi:kynurenine formamidase
MPGETFLQNEEDAAFDQKLPAFDPFGSDVDVRDPDVGAKTVGIDGFSVDSPRFSRHRLKTVDAG